MRNPPHPTFGKNCSVDAFHGWNLRHQTYNLILINLGGEMLISSISKLKTKYKNNRNFYLYAHRYGAKS